MEGPKVGRIAGRTEGLKKKTKLMKEGREGSTEGRTEGLKKR